MSVSTSLSMIFAIFICLLCAPAIALPGDEYATIDQYLTDSELDIQSISFGFAGANMGDIAPFLEIAIACEPSANLSNYTVSTMARIGDATFGESVTGFSKWHKEEMANGTITADGKRIVMVTAWVKNVRGYGEVNQVLVKNNGVVVEAVKIGNPKTGSGFRYSQQYGNDLIFNNRGVTLKFL